MKCGAVVFGQVGFGEVRSGRVRWGVVWFDMVGSGKVWVLASGVIAACGHLCGRVK